MNTLSFTKVGEKWESQVLQPVDKFYLHIEFEGARGDIEIWQKPNVSDASFLPNKVWRSTVGESTNVYTETDEDIQVKVICSVKPRLALCSA